MTRQEYKTKASLLIQTVRPPVMVVTLAVVAVGWLFSLLEQRMGASPFYIDLGAVENTDPENMFIVDWSRVTGFALAIALAFRLLTAMLDFGYIRYCLNVHRGEPSGFSDLFSGFEMPGKVLLLWLLQGMLISLLSMLLIFPGIIAGYSWSMSQRLLCDHPDWSPARCLRESRILMKGHKWELFTLHLSFFGWAILSILFPAFTVYLNPYLGLSECGLYRDLTGDTDSRTAETQDDGSNSPWEL